MQFIKRYFLFFIIIFLFSSCRGNDLANHHLISDTIQIKKDMDSIVKTPEYRNYKNIQSLNKVANYIKHQFKTISDSVTEQCFYSGDTQYKNIICSINTDKKERIIIGAHYDVCGAQDGADDNASGIVGLMELARIIKKEQLKYRIDFVAYSLEEPPFFGSEYMGSYIHAKYLYNNKINVKGMISLEMIGYFSDKPNSQHYPLGLLSWFYGTRGDYITIVQKYWNGKFGNNIRRLMKKNSLIPTKSFKGPASLPGVDFSDHRNYWKFGYSAIMITNTAFYRNKNYHTNTDKIETIDFKRLALTIDELYLTLKQIK
jgi:Zn-dependent M28 family amino/carboxypeptidase